MVSPQNVRVWPTRDEYDKALEDANLTVYDPDIKGGKLSHDSRPLRLNASSGRYVAVYKISDWVVKCFITNPVIGKLAVEPPSDICERYQKINNYLRTNISQLSFLVPQIWVEKGIAINGQDWPFVKSTFICPVQTLGQFLEERHTDRTAMVVLAKQWLTLIKTLELFHIAHGDLDATNVLVCGDYPKVMLRLVDFDSTYVPSLHGRTLYEQGHEHFQPIQQGIRTFNNEMDRFSALVIYLSLVALADDPQLWVDCKANEEAKMLLGADDFRDLRKSRAYNLLLRIHHNQNLQKCLYELECSMQEIRMPRSLPDILHSVMPFTNPSCYYVAPAIPIPLGPVSQNPQPQVLPQPISPSIILDIMIPIPIEFLAAPASTTPSPQTPPPRINHGQRQQITSPQPLQPRTNRAVWLLLAFTLLTILIIFIVIVAQNAR